MTSSSLLSSMEVMLDALMQRGIGKPDDKPKEEPPPALPTRPTVRGRPPSLNRPGAGPSPWMSSHRPPLAPIPLPTEEEEEKGKSSVHLELELEICAKKNSELETRALNAEEEVKQRDDDVRQKEEEIAALRQQVEHFESRVSEYEAKLKSVEEELQKQIVALQVAQSAGITHRRQLSNNVIRAKTQGLATRAEEASASASVSASVSMKRQQRGGGGDPGLDEKQSNHADDNNLVNEFTRESQKFDHAAKAVAEAPASVMSVDELKVLKRQFGAWRKEYEARLRKTKAELKKRVVHSEKSHDQGGGGHGSSSSSRLRRCSCSCWWRIKAPKFKPPKCCTCNLKFPKLPSPPSCSFSCCFRRRR